MEKHERKGMTRKDLLEDFRKEEELTIIRKRNFGEFWTTFTKFFRPWLHKLTYSYLDRGEFPLMGAWLLPSYYTDPEDVTIAALVGILIIKDSLVMEHVSELRTVMGDHPYEWFKDRGFVSLSIGASRNKRTGGINNGQLAEYLSYVYDSWDTIETSIAGILERTIGYNFIYNKLTLLRLILGSSDGLGRGVWAIAPSELKSPRSEAVNRLLNAFYPNYYIILDKEEAIHLFGFEKDSDFFYAALAYEEFRKKHPAEAKRLATVFHKRYVEGNFLSARYWDGSRGILPKIEF